MEAFALKSLALRAQRTCWGAIFRCFLCKRDAHQLKYGGIRTKVACASDARAPNSTQPKAPEGAFLGLFHVSRRSSTEVKTRKREWSSASRANWVDKHDSIECRVYYKYNYHHILKYNVLSLSTQSYRDPNQILITRQRNACYKDSKKF